MSFAAFSELITCERRGVAQRLYESLATQGTVDPDLFLARLREQGLVDDATAWRYQPEDTIELTVVRPVGRPSLDPTVALDQAVRSAASATVVASPDPLRPVEGFGIASAASEFTASRYRLLGRLSAGAMGEIQLAKDRGLRRKVAYKQLLSGLETQPGLAQRFLLEAQVMAQLDHPNVVPVYSLEPTAEGRFAYAMKLVRGQTLASLLQEARRCVEERCAPPAELSRERLLDHFLKVCDAMAYAHAKGVLHRDLKPANIMVGAFREVYVMDWGLARVDHAPEGACDSDGAQTLTPMGDDPTAVHTRVGEIMGTPGYMSPEQASGDNARLDARSDLYALGLILFELVSLRRALRAPSVEATLERARRGEKQPLQAPSAALKIPRELRAIIAKATATSPHERYQTVAALADDLRHFLQDQPISALPDTWLRQLLRWIGRHRQATLFALMSVLLVALGAISWSFYQRLLALAETQAYKERLSQYLTSVAEQNHLIDRHFLFFEELLEGFATATVQARLHGAPSVEPVYLANDFRAPVSAPSDLAVASRYRGKPISTAYPVHIVAPGASAASPALRELMRRVATLRHPLRRLFLLGDDPRTAHLPPPEAHHEIDEQQKPLIWAYFALQEGLFVVYPGHDPAELPAGYDPREHPWYRDAAGRDGKFWGSPHQDRLGQGLLLSCSMALFDEAKQLLGVAGLDISLDYVIDQLMTLPDPRARESFLLDPQGRIVLRSSDRHRDPAQVEARNTQAPLLYPHPDIVADVRAGHSGYREVLRDGQELWIVYDDIETLGWAYVVEFAPDLENR